MTVVIKVDQFNRMKEGACTVVVHLHVFFTPALSIQEGVRILFRPFHFIPFHFTHT